MNYPLTGLRAWLIQRFSAIYLALFSLYLIIHFSFFPSESHQAWLAWLRHPLISLAWGLFFIALLLHAWVGLRDVILDYVRPLLARAILLALVVAGLLICGLWATRLLYGA